MRISIVLAALAVVASGHAYAGVAKSFTSVDKKSGATYSMAVINEGGATYALVSCSTSEAGRLTFGFTTESYLGAGTRDLTVRFDNDAPIVASAGYGEDFASFTKVRAGTTPANILAGMKSATKMVVTFTTDEGRTLDADIDLTGASKALSAALKLCMV